MDFAINISFNTVVFLLNPMIFRHSTYEIACWFIEDGGLFP